MKHFYTSLIVLLVNITAFAQTPCDLGRYSTELFSNVTVTPNLQFGQNVNFVGSNTNLLLNVYEPTGDTETERPLIVWAHGGSFIGGTRTDADVVALSNAFAKRGFVCASIDYRVGMWPIDSVNAVKAVVRAVQDMKAAVRYFYKDKLTTNTFKIDTTRIIIAGSSAGAITALHMAYLDQECEVENYLSQATLTTLGGIEGTSGNPGYSSTVHAVVSLAGALASYGWMEAGDVPACSIQGDDDGTVPYNRGVASVSGFNVISMDGSRMIEERAAQVGVSHRLYTHYGADHAPYAMGGAYMDTTIKFVADFLVDYLDCTIPPVTPENTPTGTATLYPLTYCGLGLQEENVTEISVAPNPANDFMTVRLADNMHAASLKVVDFSGRIVAEFAGGAEWILQKSTVGSGLFLLQIELDGGQSISHKIRFN